MAINFYERSIEIAEAQSAALGVFEAAIHEVSWGLDTELSGLRKDAAGYRKSGSSAANQDGGDNGDYRELLRISSRARELLAALQPVTEVIRRFKAWDEEKAKEA